MMEHNREVAETLKLTEFQLIQAKSSWAESECEREQLFNRVQERHLDQLLLRTALFNRVRQGSLGRPRATPTIP